MEINELLDSVLVSDARIIFTFSVPTSMASPSLTAISIGPLFPFNSFLINNSHRNYAPSAQLGSGKANVPSHSLPPHEKEQQASQEGTVYSKKRQQPTRKANHTDYANKKNKRKRKAQSARRVLHTIDDRTED